jgi:diguanylate cyclase (GGDEF)-like protein
VLDVSLSLSPVRDSSGNVVAVASIERDISDVVAARRALADREESFRQLFAANPQPMWVYDVTTMTFLEINDAAVHHYGYDRDTFLAMPVTCLGPLTEGPCRHVLADGRVIDVEVTSHRLDFGGHDAVLVAVQDVTERNALDAQLRHQAFHDSLTGLSNRALFSDRVQHALGRRTASHQPILLLLDLDRFKMVNDSLGHAVGDEMLIEVAHRLEASVRVGDTVARLGGDEFAILLEDCALPAAERQATRLLHALSQPMWINGQQVVATSSIGIAVAETSVSAGDLLRNADVAMYRAKAAGGGRFQLFQPAMFEAAARHMQLTAALRHALEADQFVLHFQPVVDVATGEVTSMEALARWRHPDLGLLRPKEFIPVAEESGLIVELGAWVLREACGAAAAWPGSAGVSVNLSGVQLADPAVVEHVKGALLSSGLDPSRLTLEITESVVMQHSEANMRRLRRLRELGVVLAIDDFGTGYSSLSYLRAFPVDELKIDRSFVAAMSGDADSLALVRTIVQLAESLSLRTVAEGVETAAQYDALRALGCDKIQGFYVSRPAPVGDAVAVADGARPWHVVSSLPTQR